ncbi:MAG: hypothetical protein Q8L08_08655 [Candidatus Nanopelagicaceae bacterium]|nr:hypothetical protein [Candidatus Nanopelagicaceae bacterium]
MAGKSPNSLCRGIAHGKRIMKAQGAGKNSQKQLRVTFLVVMHHIHRIVLFIRYLLLHLYIPIHLNNSGMSQFQQ